MSSNRFFQSVNCQLYFISRYALPAFDVILKNADSNTVSVDRMRNVFTLTKYQRIIQVKDIPATLYPILLQIMVHYIPQTVEFYVKEVFTYILTVYSQL